MSKISGYANSVAALGTDDLLDVSEKISSSPDVYESRKMTGAVLATFIQSYLTNVYTSDGTLSGARTVSHGGNLLTFDGRTHIGSIGSDNSAILSAGSTNRGFLMPRLTTAQKNAVSTPATGLMLYDTDLNGFEYYNGSSWGSVGSDSIYSASGTVPTSVTATLTDSFTFSGASGTEFNIYSGLWTEDILTVFTNGGGSWKAKNGQVDIGGGATYSNYYTRFSETGIKSYGAGSVVHEINNVTGKVYFMNGYMSGQDFIVGSNSVIGSEEISLQGRTLVQGAGTAGTSIAFEVYDSDTTPASKFEIRSNGDIYTNGTQGLSNTYTFGGGSTGDIASMTFTNGILTAVTTVP